MSADLLHQTAIEPLYPDRRAGRFPKRCGCGWNLMFQLIGGKNQYTASLRLNF